MANAPACLRNQMTSTVSVKAAATQDDYGNAATLGAATERAAYVWEETEQVRTVDGTRLEERTRVVVDAADGALGADAFVWLPGESVDDDPGHRASKVLPRRRLDGEITHYEIHL